MNILEHLIVCGPGNNLFSRLRYWLYKRRLLRSDGYFISGSRFNITLPENVVIGSGCKFDDDVLLRSTGKEKGTDSYIQIGNNVRIHSGVTILTGDHDWSQNVITDSIRADVKIGDNVIVFPNVTILPGASIGKSSIIGAGSVVTHNIPDDVIACGNPCRILRKRGEYINKNRERILVDVDGGA